jgi:hypothetical protein
MRIATIVVRTLLGLLFLFASVAYFLDLLFALFPKPELTGAAKSFNEGLEAVGYFVPLLKVVELRSDRRQHLLLSRVRGPPRLAGRALRRARHGLRGLVPSRQLSQPAACALTAGIRPAARSFGKGHA